MIIYVDVLLFVNTIINYFILITAERLLKLKAATWRIILASFTGALFALSAFIDVRSFFLTLLIKVVSTLAISAIAFRFHSFKELLKHCLMTLCASFLFSGIMIAIYRFFKPANMLIVNDIVYFQINPLLLIALTVIIYVCVLIIERIFRERIRNSVVRLEMTAGDLHVACIGKIDTGCSLTEPFTGAPVIVVDSAVMTLPDKMNRRIIPYRTVGGSSLLFAVKADSVSINDKQIEKAVYLAAGNVNNSAYQAIIHSDIVR